MREQTLREIAKTIVDLKARIATTRCYMCNGSNYLEYAYLSEKDTEKNIALQIEELKQLIKEQSE